MPDMRNVAPGTAGQDALVVGLRPEFPTILSATTPNMPFAVTAKRLVAVGGTGYWELYASAGVVGSSGDPPAPTDAVRLGKFTTDQMPTVAILRQGVSVGVWVDGVKLYTFPAASATVSPLEPCAYFLATNAAVGSVRIWQSDSDDSPDRALALQYPLAAGLTATPIAITRGPGTTPLVAADNFPFSAQSAMAFNIKDITPNSAAANYVLLGVRIVPTAAVPNPNYLVAFLAKKITAHTPGGAPSQWDIFHLEDAAPSGTTYSPPASSKINGSPIIADNLPPMAIVRNGNTLSLWIDNGKAPTYAATSLPDTDDLQFAISLISPQCSIANGLRSLADPGFGAQNPVTTLQSRPMSDNWEWNYFTDPLNPANPTLAALPQGDATTSVASGDGDGRANLEEYVQGTSPNLDTSKAIAIEWTRLRNTSSLGGDGGLYASASGADAQSTVVIEPNATSTVAFRLHAISKEASVGLSASNTSAASSDLLYGFKVAATTGAVTIIGGDSAGLSIAGCDDNTWFSIRNDNGSVSYFIDGTKVFETTRNQGDKDKRLWVDCALTFKGQRITQAVQFGATSLASPIFGSVSSPDMTKNKIVSVLWNKKTWVGSGTNFDGAVSDPNIKYVAATASQADATSRQRLVADGGVLFSVGDTAAAPSKRWTFDSSVESWTASGGTLTASSGQVALDLDPSSSQGTITSPSVSIAGATDKKFSMKIRRKPGTSGDGWGATLEWRHSIVVSGVTSYVWSSPVSLEDPGDLSNDKLVSYNAATDAEWSGTITNLRIKLGESAQDAFLIDEIAVGKTIPPIYVGLDHSSDSAEPADIEYGVYLDAANKAWAWPYPGNAAANAVYLGMADTDTKFLVFRKSGKVSIWRADDADTANWAMLHEFPGQDAGPLFADTSFAAQNGMITNARIVYSTGDADGDEISDQWEIANFGSVTKTDGATSRDADGDGVSDKDEYLTGTNPNDSASRAALVHWARKRGTQSVADGVLEGVAAAPADAQSHTAMIGDGVLTFQVASRSKALSVGLAPSNDSLTAKDQHFAFGIKSTDVCYTGRGTDPTSASAPATTRKVFSESVFAIKVSGGLVYYYIDNNQVGQPESLGADVGKPLWVDVSMSPGAKIINCNRYTNRFQGIHFINGVLRIQNHCTFC